MGQAAMRRPWGQMEAAAGAPPGDKRRDPLDDADGDGDKGAHGVRGRVLGHPQRQAELTHAQRRHPAG
jgi:hypothetical protein